MEPLGSSRGPYAILDVDSLEARGLDLVESAAAMLAGGASLLQLRAKGRSARPVLAWLEALVPLARGAHVPLIVNDRADLAAVSGATGVHVGQEDLPVAEVRRLFPELLVGISTHSLPQLEAALADRPDYVALGPIFATQSKANPDPVVGLDQLARAVALAQGAGVPLVAIGGIDSRSAHDIRAAGAVPAVIGALLPPLGEVFAGRPFTDTSGAAVPRSATATVTDVIRSRTRALCAVEDDLSGPA